MIRHVKVKSNLVNLIVVSFTLVCMNVYGGLALEQEEILHIHEHGGSAQTVQAITHHAHVHGLSEIRLVIENKTIEIELESPAVDLVGFEHYALTKENIVAVDKTELILGQYKRLFSFTGGNCKLVSYFSNVLAIKQSKVDSHQHDKNHSEITAKYSFYCDETKDLSSIAVTVFDVFSGVKQINAMWITEIEQNATTLNAKNNIIYLK